MLRLLTFLVGVLAASMAMAGDKALWIQATGIAAITSKSDVDSARRRALADALLSAALAGGSELKGYTAVDKGVITKDLTIVSARGRILKHEVLDTYRAGNYWKTRIRAKVGAVTAAECRGSRRMIVTAYAPAIRVDPYAPAWTARMAHTLSARLMDILDRHPNTRLEQVSAMSRANSQPQLATGFDYNALTRGSIQQRSGDQAFETVIDVRAFGQTLSMDTELRITDVSGRPIQSTINNTTVVPELTSLSQATGKTRARAEADLTEGVEERFRTMLDQLACTPPEARLKVAGGQITAPVGTRHGLSRGSLGVIVDQRRNFGFFEITSLGKDKVVLRPLDRTAKASQFNGARVEFLDTGL